MESLAIIGTGIAGMSAGYFLKNQCRVTFFEKNDYPGGHTNTVTIDEEGRLVPIDTGFMVYNEITYPHLTRLFKELDVKTMPTSMSFSVSHQPSGLEYCGTGIRGLFSRRKNIFNPRFIHLLTQMNRFNHQSVEVLTDPQYSGYTTQEYAEEKGFGEDFLQKYLLPMSSAVWSTPLDLMLKFPIVTLVRFFKNHGFLGLRTHHQWRTVVGGSKEYRDKILGLFKDNVFLKCPITKIVREKAKVQLYDSSGTKRVYDKVILASHADQSLSLLSDATLIERRVLKKFRYQKNRATLHTDFSVMPQTKRAWSSWNYRLSLDLKGRIRPSTVYYMNSLQKVSKKKDYFISINDPMDVHPAKILWETEYEHPIFDLDAISAQQELPVLNEDGRVFFCGSYFKYGFHEDALESGLNVARLISKNRIWP